MHEIHTLRVACKYRAPYRPFPPKCMDTTNKDHHMSCAFGRAKWKGSCPFCETQ